jgi:hypothetical protein
MQTTPVRENDLSPRANVRAWAVHSLVRHAKPGSQSSHEVQCNKYF